MQKTRFSAVLSTFIVCFAFWVLLTWSFDAQELIAGAIVSFFAALFSARFFIHEKAFWLFNPAKLFNLIAYLFVFLGELISANVDVARRCFTGCKDVHPGIVRIPTELKGDYAQATLANSITLTPGTITLDIAEDETTGQNYFYVHCIDVSGFEPKDIYYSDYTGKEQPLTLNTVNTAADAIKGKMEKWIRRIWE